MSIAVSAQGTLLKIESGTSVGSYLTVPEVHKLQAPNVKYALLDATSHDSPNGFQEYVPGLADGDNCTAEFWYVPANAIHTQLRVDSYAKTKKNFKIMFASAGAGGEVDFTAYIVGLNPVLDSGQLQKNTMTAKVTGAPTWI